MTNNIQLANDLSCSRIVHGYWRLNDWKISTEQIKQLLEESLALGISTIDHADIYGDYECEAVFGQALKGNSSLRDKLQLVSKCGIMLVSDKFPKRSVKHYNYSAEHIINSAEQSCENLQTDRLDLLLLHRPSPFYNPEEVAKAFDALKTAGVVRHFGVSNFTPRQFSSLQSYCDMPLVTNQIELSVGCLEHFDNGNIDYLLEKRVHPMAWSPLGGGVFFKDEYMSTPMVQAVHKVASELEIDDISQVMYAWLLNHPVGILPIVGSSNIHRIKSAVAALNITLTHEQWFKIYEASLGHKVP